MYINKKILLIISGSIAAYRSLELIRLLRSHELEVNCILTKAGAKFITPLSISSISGTKTYSELFSLKDEVEMGHIRLAREADIIVIVPATADIIAKTANGIADNLANATLLASAKHKIFAPAMNYKMWENPATQRNIQTLKNDGIEIISPESGSLACGEVGVGRMASPDIILSRILKSLLPKGALLGKKALVTSGATHELIDPVRYIGNLSSGKQGFAIAESLAKAGADVTLISGVATVSPPSDISIINVRTAEEMFHATMSKIPVDIAVFAAAVADWRPDNRALQKIKKTKGRFTPTLNLVQTPDILANVGMHKINRPKLVIGFAAETENIYEYAEKKRKAKNCDWMLGNDTTNSRVFGEDNTKLIFFDDMGVNEWGKMSKISAADKLTDKIIKYFKNNIEKLRIV